MLGTIDIEYIVKPIDIEYIVKPKDAKIIKAGGSNNKRWWFNSKPKYWEITHIKQTYLADITHIINIGYIKRDGVLIPLPLYVLVDDADKYNKLVLVKKRKAKLLKLQNV